MKINEDKLTGININFAKLRENRLDESWLAMFGAWTKDILRAMFGELNIPVKVTGNKREIDSFARAMGSEKNYIEAARRYGLDDPRTYRNKAQLEMAAKQFERATNLKWPFI